MNDILIYVGITTVLAFAFFALFFIGLLKNNKKMLIWSAVFFVLSAVVAIWSVMVVARKTVDKIEETLEPRSGEEIYQVLLGKPSTCVNVRNSLDQMIPKMDAAIYLEAEMCPDEILRIQDTLGFDYETVVTDTVRHASPEWLITRNLGDSMNVYTRVDEMGNGKVIMLSKDSSRMYLVDYLD